MVILGTFLFIPFILRVTGKSLESLELILVSDFGARVRSIGYTLLATKAVNRTKSDLGVATGFI